LLAARHGRLVAEYYFGGADSTTRFDVRSVTKSIVGGLTGIALRDGVLPGVAASIAPYLAPPDTLDSADSSVTVHDLLTMTSGYQWNEETGDDYNLWISAENHVQYLLDRPHATAPGVTFTYNSAAVHTLGVVLQDAAAMPLPQYAAPLFSALGVDTVVWDALDRGTVHGGAEPRCGRRRGHRLEQRVAGDAAGARGHGARRDRQRRRACGPLAPLDLERQPRVHQRESAVDRDGLTCDPPGVSRAEQRHRVAD